MVDEVSRLKKSIHRQSRSCKVCRLRKVKCDRVNPCHACCAHGYPSKCVYESAPDDDLRPISQAEEIRNLRTEIRELRQRIDSQGQRNRNLRRLENLFVSIRSAPHDVVERIIDDIRTARDGLERRSGSVGPWEGTEVYEDLLYRSPPPPRSRWSKDRDQDHKSCSEDDIEEIDRFPGSSSPESDSSSMIVPMSSYKPALDVFVQRFVDAFSPEVDVKAGQAGALRAAAGIRMFSPILTDAFEAVSVAFFGRSIQDRSIEIAGFKLYPRVLHGLQQALLDPERSKAESTLVTVILLIAFESVERTTQTGVAAHVHGATRLIEHRGPENHIYGVEHLMFTEMRPYWVGSALVRRTPSFLAREEWKTIPWSAGTTTKDILHHLLDLAVEIPALLSQYDDLEVAQQSTVWSEHEITVKQTALWNGVADLTQRFLHWKQTWVDLSPDGPPQEIRAEPNDIFPTFYCRSLLTGQIITPTKYVFPNLRVAQTMCVYYATRLILSSVDTRLDRVTPLEQYDLACGICRSLEWYILTAPGNMINRFAFPVRVAWEAFPAQGPEKQFIKEVLSLVEKRHSLGLWGSGMPELSPRAGSPPKNIDPQAVE